MRWTAVAFALVLVSCTPSVTKVVFAVDPHWPPLEYLDEAGQPAGFDIDLAKALADKGGFQAEFVPVAWDSLFSGLEAGRFDAIISSVVATDALATKYAFSEPYLNAGQVLTVGKGSKASQLADLKGQPVGALPGTFGADAVLRVAGATSLRTFATADQAFAQLAAGSLAGVVTETPVAAQYAVRTPRYTGRFKVVGQPLTDENYALVVRSGNTNLLTVLNASLAKVKASNTLTDLASRWLR